jgi:hypothetical protein
MWLRSCLLSLPIISLAASPTDAELLQIVKDRAALERVTPKPITMTVALSSRCGIDPIEVGDSVHSGVSSLIYANESGALPLFNPWGKFPVSSLLLKEKFTADHKTECFTGMWKREADYFPEVNDWEFFTVDEAASKIIERGRLPRCASCHQEFKKGDCVSKEFILPAQLSGGRIILHSSRAKATGETLHYEEEEKKNTLGYWSNPADWASWAFEVSRPGTYEIHLWQGCGKGSGGSEVAITTADQTATFLVEDTGHFQNFIERVMGRVTFQSAGPQTLEVRPRTKPGVAVMDLQQIILVPVPTGQEKPEK